jgi:Uma2 family endonuclease
MESAMAAAILPATLPYHPARLTVERYHALVAAGTFTEEDRVELLDGVVASKMPKNPRHSATTRRCDLLLSSLLTGNYHVQNQEPITLSNSEPEPDVAVIRGGLADYTERHPSGVETMLVVEVSDTTLITDRYKSQLYAAEMIAEYWIVNLQESCIEVHSDPESSAAQSLYRSVRVFGLTEDFSFQIAGRNLGQIAVAEIIVQ